MSPGEEAGRRARVVKTGVRKGLLFRGRCLFRVKPSELLSRGFLSTFPFLRLPLSNEIFHRVHLEKVVLFAERDRHRETRRNGFEGSEIRFNFREEMERVHLWDVEQNASCWNSGNEAVDATLSLAHFCSLGFACDGVRGVHVLMDFLGPPQDSPQNSSRILQLLCRDSMGCDGYDAFSQTNFWSNCRRNAPNWNLDSDLLRRFETNWRHFNGLQEQQRGQTSRGKKRNHGAVPDQTVAISEGPRRL